MKVSIIVPAYNVESYINDCLDSILKQTYQDFEVILIDDGSKDGTLAQLNQYASKDSRIMVIHKDNEGQSIARNKGMEAATGDYIFFMDGDDLLPANALEALVKVVQKKKYDIVCGSYVRIEQNQRIRTIKLPVHSGSVSRYGSKEKRRRFHTMKTKSIFGYVWGKLYKRSFLLENELVFDDIRKIYMEDTLFNLKLFCHNPSYYFLKKVVYQYNVRKDSTTKQYEKLLTDKLLSMLETYKKYLVFHKSYAENLDLYLPLSMRVFSWAAIKNNPGSGNLLSHIKKTVTKFGNHNDIREAVWDKQAIQSIVKIQGLSEKAFFLLCVYALRFGCYNLLTLVFFLLYPIHLLYIRLFVK